MSPGGVWHPGISTATSATGVRSTAEAAETCVGHNRVVVRIDTGLRTRANLPREAIDINLTLLAAFLIHAAYEP
jgi:hypothetical protein